jgi:hypothetical protein
VLVLGHLPRADPMLRQKIFDISTTETHDSADPIARKFSRFSDAIDCHRIQMKQVRELSDSKNSCEFM